MAFWNKQNWLNKDLLTCQGKKGGLFGEAAMKKDKFYLQ